MHSHADREETLPPLGRSVSDRRCYNRRRHNLPRATRLVLASSSPRRMEVLSSIGLRFDVVRPGIDEVPPSPMPPVRYVQWAAESKARAVAKRVRDALVIGADTEVVLDGQVFGKPLDRPHARRMLRALSGRTHMVYTAIHVIDIASHCQARGFSRTRVTLRRLSKRQIDRYVRTGEVQDKAGAYAIQARGRQLVRSIQGPFDNVVGMPVHLLRRLLRECGVSLPPSPRR